MQTPESIPILDSTPTPRKRLFEAGEMKLLVLHFIAESPKYSYDVIKSISTFVGSDYKPSTGTICPNIDSLEQQQYIEFKLKVDDRKQYSITEKGMQYLIEKADQIEHIHTRFETRRRIHTQTEFIDIKRAMENLKSSLRLKLQTELSPEQVRELAEQIDQAAVNIARM
ncbi:MAG: PadR family transcriptional regulator [Candidatus Acinetobacter avistercoris]|uniref:PadR family transcriptional regulator n=1 Tax=Acinetobacter sp. KS-LM10 TaxID=3120518 RepID=UPI001F9503E3|nr:PadR family transcriptional regulator [Candidatus Acinetobacter avistercoris]